MFPENLPAGLSQRKKVQADWSIVLGEAAIDIKAGHISGGKGGGEHIDGEQRLMALFACRNVVLVSDQILLSCVVTKLWNLFLLSDNRLANEKLQMSYMKL